MVQHLVKPLLSGLAASEIISFFLVRASNLHLGDAVRAMGQAGHLVVPNARVVQTLDSFPSAFFPAQFLVMTAGLFVTLVSLLTCRGLFSGIKQKRTRTALFILFFILSNLWIILDHGRVQSVKALAFTLVIPLVVFGAMAVSAPGKGMAVARHSMLSFLIALSIGGTLLVTQADQGFFLGLRDHILFDNQPGESIVRYYYRYTPSAAQAIQAPLKQQIKPCWIHPDIPGRKKVEKILAGFGWLTVDHAPSADLILDKTSGSLNFLLKTGKPIVPDKGVIVGVREFISSPKSHLEAFSQKADTGGGLRQLCLWGLVTALPVFCLLVFFLAAGWAAGIFLPPALTAPAAGLITALLPLILIRAVMPLNPEGPSTLEERLSSENAGIRVAGLRTLSLSREKESIWDHPMAVARLKMGTTPERYWLANALALARRPESVGVLKALMKDPALNVRCAAIRGLSRLDRGGTAKGLFREIIATSSHWYEQQYAWQAFKRCRP
ncbi:MAG: HEAT repeat domain-containing protein [Desulfobacterium sp.]|nr:HEAT repeat domain-containing protein [Desulfobacterium sp.]